MSSVLLLFCSFSVLDLVFMVSSKSRALSPDPTLKSRVAKIFGHGSSKSSGYTPSEASAGLEPLSEAMTKVVLEAYDAHFADSRSADALTAWLNARWKKTGFQMGIPDPLNGAFYRQIHRPTAVGEAIEGAEESNSPCEEKESGTSGEEK